MEAFGVEGDLGDHGVVGDHHGHGPEEDFEVVGQFGTACVALVHGDEDRAGGVEAKFGVVEVEGLFALGDGALDGLDLLSYDWNCMKRLDVFRYIINRT